MYYGPEQDVKFPTKIPVVMHIIGWSFIVWSIVNFFTAHSSHTINLSDLGAFNAWGSLIQSMCILHLILGCVFILNGLALSKIISSSQEELERLRRQPNK